MPQEIDCRISHIAEQYTGYPGESVRLRTLVDAISFKGGTLVISLPAGMTLRSFEKIPVQNGSAARVADTPQWTTVSWELPPAASSAPCEFVTEGILPQFGYDTFLNTEAVVYDQDGQELCSQTLRIYVKDQGEYLKFLPELYRKDALMNRFLMLFESFWKPIEQQIRQVSCYFDPDLTPEDMLPWLASWVGAFWDPFLPEDRQRNLLRTAVSQYQRRGTRLALEEFLLMYTAGEIMITEHPARNFVLGEDARLGQRVAFGLDNSPHMFSVDIRLDTTKFNIPGDMEKPMLENLFRQKLDVIINLLKPAHTDHRLNLEIYDGSYPIKSSNAERIEYEQ